MQVNEARDAGTLKDTPCGTGFYLFAPDDKTPVETRAEAAERVHSEAVERAKQKESGELFAQMKESLRAGVQVVVAPQLFPTPPELAARMVELAEIEPGQRVLEPSCGTGNIVKAAFDAWPVHIVAVEINARVLEATREQWTTWDNSRIDWRAADFLQCNGELGTFDRIVMNPPFQNAVDIQHIEHALHMLNPGGRLVAICANGPRQQAKLKPMAEEWIDLPAGTFKDQGTGVNTALLVIQR